MRRGGPKKKKKTGVPAHPPTTKADRLLKRIPKTQAVALGPPGEGDSYAGLIRKAKDAVPNLKELGVEVVGTRRTANGQVLLELKTAEEADLLAATLKEKMGAEANVRRPTRMTPILVMGVEESVTTEELRVALGVEDCDVKQFSIRSSADGYRTARIEVSMRAAARLTKARVLKVGWATCRVKLLPEKKRLTCFRCQEEGHMAAACRGEDLSGRCFRCRKEGHVARDCRVPSGEGAKNSQ